MTIDLSKLIIREMHESDIEKIIKNYLDQGWKNNADIDVFKFYHASQSDGSAYVFMAEYDDDITGFVVLFKEAGSGPFANKGIPEISNLSVFMKNQNNGIASKLLDIAEKKASEFSNIVSLAVGLHSGYGQAQRIYVKRGYIPDGTGVWYGNSQLEQYADCKNDDLLLLFFSKELT